MNESLYQPIPTCDIPLPIVEGPRSAPGHDPELPRVLLQAAGRRSATRRVILLTLLFLAASAFEGALLARLRGGGALVVYHDVPKKHLVELRER